MDRLSNLAPIKRTVPIVTQKELDQAGLPIGYPYDPEWECTPREVAAMRGDGRPLVLIDCWTDLEREIANIDGSLHAPMQDIRARLQDLLEHEQDRVVVYCHHGVRSRQVTGFLREEGFEDVRLMAGGIDLDPMPSTRPSRSIEQIGPCAC